MSSQKIFTPQPKAAFKDMVNLQQHQYFLSTTKSRAQIHSKQPSFPSITFNKGDVFDLTEQNEVLKLQVKKLQSELRSSIKEIQRLNYQNQFLLQQNQNKGSLISNERKNFTKYKDVVYERQCMIDSLIKQKESKDKPRISIRHSVSFDGQAFGTQVTQLGGLLENQQATANGRIIENQFKLSSLLDLDISEVESSLSYSSDPHIRFMSSLVVEEDKFIQILQSSGYQKINYIFEKLKKVVSDHKQFFITLMRMKQFLRAAIHMTTSQTLDDVLDNIIQECVECIDCDRASCFILDENKGQLWSRVARGVNGVIRMPSNQGVAGYVATSKSLLNIHKAYSDPRFNPDTDKMTNYKTNTILCVPILLQDKCLGVLECINKKDGVFSREDECLAKILCEFSKIILSHAISVDEQVITIIKLRQSVKQGVQLRNLVTSNLYDKLFMCEKLLKQLMNVDQARIVVRKNDNLIFIKENGEIQEVSGFQGVIGQSIKLKRTLLVPSSYDSIYYSPLVDLQTSIPVVCIPISDKDKIYGAFMLPNVRGIQSIVAHTEAHLQSIDEEILLAFSQQLVQLFSQ